MDREQMIDRAAEILWRTGMGLSLDGLEWSNTSNQDSYQRRARAVLDAILPQVTTVKELEALPHGTRLISADGKIITRYHGPLGPTQASVALLPLTVVWRP